MDNLFRFVQAGAEVSGLLGRLPSRVGYQPTLASEVGALQERIASAQGVAMTAIEAVYVPADDFTDPAVTTIASHVDSIVMLSRAMAAEGMYPAIDPIASSSILLDPLIVGKEHAEVATQARRAIEHYRGLQDVIALLGIEELGAEDRVLVERARRLQRFLTQPFSVTEAFSGTPGRSVALADTIAGCKAILAGECDGWRENSLLHDWGARRGARQGSGDVMNVFRLRIVTPSQILVDRPDVASLRAEDESGGFGVLAGHADLLTVLPASVLSWRGVEGGWSYCVTSGGVLTVSAGQRVEIACRRGALGDDLSRLRAEVEALRAAEIDAERRAKVDATRLHARAVRQLMRLLRPEGAFASGGEGEA